MIKSLSRIRWIFLSLLFLTVFYGCGGSNSNRQVRTKQVKEPEVLNSQIAEQVIIKNLELPFKTFRKFNFNDLISKSIYRTSFMDWIWGHFKVNGYLYLHNQGYIAVSGDIRAIPGVDYSDMARYGGHGQKGSLIFEFAINEKANPYIVDKNAGIYTIEVGGIQFNSLNNLRQINEGEYEVEFSLKTISNDFGEAFKKGIIYDDDYSTQSFRLNNETVNLKVKIYKYESGWQVATDDLQNLKDRYFK